MRTLSTQAPDVFITSAKVRKHLKTYYESQLRDYLPVSEATTAVSLTLTSEHTGVYNIASGMSIPTREITMAVLRIVNPVARVRVFKYRMKPTHTVLHIHKATNQPGFITSCVFFPDNVYD